VCIFSLREILSHPPEGKEKQTEEPKKKARQRRNTHKLRIEV